MFGEVVPLGRGCEPKANIAVLPFDVVAAPDGRVPGRVDIGTVTGAVLGVRDRGTLAVGVDVVIVGDIGFGMVTVLYHVVETGEVPAVGFGTKEAFEDKLLWFLKDRLR